jgi:predicted hydrolase (HD superfamily)
MVPFRTGCAENYSLIQPGAALVKTHFPEWTYDSETYYLACLLHDIGDN